MPNVKVLLSGDVKGQLQTVCSRVQLVNQKSGPFDALLCVGDFFGDLNDATHAAALHEQVAAYISGVKKVPVPVFFVGAPDAASQALLDELAAADCGVKHLGRLVISSQNDRSWQSPSGVRGMAGCQQAPAAFSSEQDLPVQPLAVFDSLQLCN